jgi:hypothetical protein
MEERRIKKELKREKEMIKSPVRLESRNIVTVFIPHQSCTLDYPNQEKNTHSGGRMDN